MSAYREKIVQWVSRQSREVQQWTANELIDGDRFERRQPGRTLPQLPRFGLRDRLAVAYRERGGRLACLGPSLPSGFGQAFEQ